MILLLILACMHIDIWPCSGHYQTQYPFQNTSLSWDERVDDLVQRLTVAEMAAQMAYGGRTTHAPAISRLGIKPYPWGSECLRGDIEAGPATSFPQALGLSATFSRETVYAIARATGLEVRAKYNNYTAHEDYGQHTSASCWSPVINIMRDPRWGRNQETYGEDPYLSGELAWAFVKGLQGKDARYVLANAGCKHFAVYGGPENIPESRHYFDAKVSVRDLRMTFLPQFKSCVEAGSYSLMCSYNSINGIPACANSKLLKDILRDEWGFNGYVISDEGAIEDIMDTHKYTFSKSATAAAAVNAGTNLEDGPSRRPPYYANITQAVNEGKLTVTTINHAVKPLFYTRMRLGEFDPKSSNPFAQLKPSEFVQSPAHRELAIQTSMKSFVLLKNNHLLPFKSGQTFGTLAIVGPVADNIDVIFGGYAPTPDPEYIQTPRQGLKSIAKIEHFAPGCKNSDPKCDEYDSTSVIKVVSGADLVIVCLGTGSAVESESNDRSDINLPGKQLQLLQDAVSTARDKPLILLLFNAGPLDISWAKYNPGVHVILECFFPAQATGEALYRTFYNNNGTASNPAGRLTATWPTSLSQIPHITNYTMEGRTYRYFKGSPLYPFGYGLSYSNFTYRTLDIRPSRIGYGQTLKVDVYVENNGPFDAEEVVQVYVQHTSSYVPVAKLQLVGFDRVAIDAGMGVSCQFKITREQLAVWDDDKGFINLSETMNIYVGGQQPKQETLTHSNVLNSTFDVLSN